MNLKHMIETVATLSLDVEELGEALEYEHGVAYQPVSEIVQGLVALETDLIHLGLGKEPYKCQRWLGKEVKE